MDDIKIYFYLKGELTPGEQREVEEWIRNNPEQFEKIKLIWENSEIKMENKKPDLINAWKKINPEKDNDVYLKPQSGTKFLLKFQRIAAILIIGVGLGTLSYYFINRNNNTEWIEFTSNNKKNTELLLSDGSKIWLNKGSTIYYPKKFKSGKREITLSGEAFFKVAHDKRRPFLINAGNTITKVLGTSFNINANNISKNVIVTVTSGKVAFINKTNTDQQVVLVKGEKGVYESKEKQITKQENHDQNFMAWQTGTLIFDNVSLPEVCEVLTRFYDTSVFVQHPDLVKEHLIARFHNKTLDEILEVIKITFEIECKKSEKGIELTTN